MTNINQTLINAVFATARKQALSVTACVDAILACKPDWTNADALAPISDAYKSGRVSASLNVSQKEALAILAMKPFEAGKAGNDRRTETQHKACRSAISGWSAIRLLAGAPSAQSGKTRGARAPNESKAAKAKALKDKRQGVIPAVVAAKSVNDVNAYALKIASHMSKYLTMNAKLVQGDLGSAMRAYVTDVAKAVRPEQKAA